MKDGIRAPEEWLKTMKWNKCNIKEFKPRDNSEFKKEINIQIKDVHHIPGKINLMNT